MIQDIYPQRMVNSFVTDIAPGDGDLVLSFKGDELLFGVDEDKKEIKYPKVRDFKGIDKGTLYYLFNAGDENFFLLTADEEQPKGYGYRKFRDLRDEYLSPKHYVFAAFTAYQLSEWYTVTRFCGKCGSPNENDKRERARICPKCGNKIYPRINPAVIIGVTNPSTNQIILTRYRTGFGHNALVAGFTEIGETLEETVAREVMEEVGLKVRDIRYYKSQPWGVASDILMGFFCDVDGDTEIRMDESELKYAEWVSPEDIVLQPLDYSLTNEMMRLFKENGYNATKK